MGGNVLDHMIEDILIAKEAAKRNLTVTDEELNTAYQQIFGYFANGTPTPTVVPTAVVESTLNPTQMAIVTLTPTAPVVPTETPAPTATLDPAATLAPSPTPYTADGFAKVTTNFYTSMQSINITEPFIKNLLRTQLLGQKLSAAMGKDIPTTKDQVWARHILVADEATAQTVETRLKNGEDFAAIAKELSTDTGTKDNGGDLGWFAQGTMVAEFDTAVFAMKVGEISQPVKTSFGYHVIQVLGHENRPLSATDLASAQSTSFNTWIQAQLADPSVVRNDAWTQNVPSIPAFTAPNLDAVNATPTP
jgi:parvulin-like peptidyl-prolyl isomerase